MQLKCGKLYMVKKCPYKKECYQEKANIVEKIDITRFGKDHWDLLTHIEYRIMNHKGVLSLTHLRIKHPALQQNRLGENLWKPEYGTKLHGYWNEDGSVNPKLKILDHDDYDCLDDLENAGLIKSWGTGLHPAYKLTKKGVRVVGLLILHKQEGKHYASFVLSESELKKVREIEK